MIRARLTGFTLVELMVAIGIAAMLLAVSVPASVRMYESMQYRAAVREVITALTAARHAAVTSGQARDVTIHPARHELSYAQSTRQLPDRLSLTVHAARSLNQRGAGVIRFYPEGGSSGGGVDIERPNGGGVSIAVDWLMGSVSQRPLDSQQEAGGAR